MRGVEIHKPLPFRRRERPLRVVGVATVLRAGELGYSFADVFGSAVFDVAPRRA
jgi:hypothetical protein